MATLATVSPTFQPAMRIIAGITNASPAVVTTSFDHNYITGLIVRLYIPLGYGISQLDKYEGPITVLSDTTFSLDVDSTEFDTYTTPSAFPLDRQYAQVVPTGEINSTLAAATDNVLG